MSEFGFAEPRGPGGLRAEMFPFHSRLGWSSIQLPSQTAGRAKCKAQGSSCKVGDCSLPQKAGRLLLELPPVRARVLLVFIPLVLPFHALGPSHVWLFLPPCLSCALFVSHSAFAPSSPSSSDFFIFFSKSAGPGTGWASRASLGELKKLPSVPSWSVQVGRALQQLTASGQPAPTGGGGVLKPTRSGVLRGDGFLASAGLVLRLVALLKDAGLVCLGEAGARQASETNGEEEHRAGVPAPAEGEASGRGEAGRENGR